VRIASLLPSATEIVCALGLEGDLVAVTHECDFPPSVRLKPVVTRSLIADGGSSRQIDRHIRRLVHQGSSIYALDADRLHALEPDLILTQELCEVCAVSYPMVERAARQLDAGTRLVSLEPDSLSDVFENIQLVGLLTGQDAAAYALVQCLRERTDAIQRRLAGRAPRRVVTLEWIDPPYNCGHWTPGLIELAGGYDLLGTAGRPARPLTWEQVASASPELIIVSACGFSLERSVEEAQRITHRLDVAPDGVYVIDGNAYLSRPGPRLVDSIEIVAGILHPDAVEPTASTASRRLR
jgi:iron complex transport system substrate-binding protein